MYLDLLSRFITKVHIFSFITFFNIVAADVFRLLDHVQNLFIKCADVRSLYIYLSLTLPASE